jgi:hypothetical protein
LEESPREKIVANAREEENPKVKKKETSSSAPRNVVNPKKMWSGKSGEHYVFC